MKKIAICITLLALSVCVATETRAQLLKKLKDKVEKKVLNKTDEKKEDNPSTSSGNEQEQTNTGGKPTNKGGGGLKNTAPPDVNQQITDAETAHKAGNYSDARYSIQQALMGVEIQLGREILKSLPPEAAKLPKDTLQDKVMSTQWGWNNMTIQRVYTDQKDKQLTITIGNNSVYSAFASAYFSNMYVQQADNENQKSKQVRVKSNKAIIQYDDSKGYTLIMPMGQTSVIVWECINFADENEVINTASSFDIDGIKKMMGEK
ncbi:MAG: hypothetical protein JNK14_10250 [Chitinophagaceae bacterium]|nr:hypothetical protein [Chitinophagaceae bacterium]